ncbi:anthrone oxygenase family protein [Nocardia sp. R16R-3T]
MAISTEPQRRTSTPVTPFVRIAALLTTGILAGAFAYGRFVVFPTFFDVPTDIQLRFRVPLMDRNAPLMPPLMAGVLISCLLLVAFAKGRERVLAGLASASALACMLITFFGNVPINTEVKTWDLAALPANSADLLDRWNMYNDLRSIAAIAPFLLILGVLLPAMARTTSTPAQ